MPMTAPHIGGFAPDSKWGRAFWADLGERVGSTFVYGLITLISMDNVLEGPDWDTTLWPIVVLPTALSLLKGLLANMKDPQSGASLLDSPPGPVLEDERGAVSEMLVIGLALGFLLGVVVLYVLR